MKKTQDDTKLDMEYGRCINCVHFNFKHRECLVGIEKERPTKLSTVLKFRDCIQFQESFDWLWGWDLGFKSHSDPAANSFVEILLLFTIYSALFFFSTLLAGLFSWFPLFLEILSITLIGIFAFQALFAIQSSYRNLYKRGLLKFHHFLINLIFYCYLGIAMPASILIVWYRPRFPDLGIIGNNLIFPFFGLWVFFVLSVIKLPVNIDFLAFFPEYDQSITKQLMKSKKDLEDYFNTIITELSSRVSLAFLTDAAAEKENSKIVWKYIMKLPQIDLNQFDIILKGGNFYQKTVFSLNYLILDLDLAIESIINAIELNAEENSSKETMLWLEIIKTIIDRGVPTEFSEKLIKTLLDKNMVLKWPYWSVVYLNIPKPIQQKYKFAIKNSNVKTILPQGTKVFSRLSTQSQPNTEEEVNGSEIEHSIQRILQKLEPEAEADYKKFLRSIKVNPDSITYKEIIEIGTTMIKISKSDKVCKDIENAFNWMMDQDYGSLSIAFGVYFCYIYLYAKYDKREKVREYVNLSMKLLVNNYFNPTESKIQLLEDICSILIRYDFKSLAEENYNLYHPALLEQSNKYTDSPKTFAELINKIETDKYK